MANFDFTLLNTPVSAEEPCGADLDLSGDIGYLNFMAGAESLLPKSYFGKDKAGNEGRPFDRTSINFDEQFEAAKPFFKKTRDLRLIGILAKLCILNRDLAGFVACFNAIGTLLATQWDHIHPRGEDGDFSFRAATLESLDVFPTVVLPLQFASLFEHKRLGSFSYRAYLISRGEVKPTEGEAEIDPAAVEKMLAEIELERLIAVRGQIGELESAIKKIHSVWQE